jgi:pimeloyl-ACP methyl ester carboxylesterase
MNSQTLKRRLKSSTLFVISALLGIALISSPIASAQQPTSSAATEVATPQSTGAKPTVVLVHGAFADASGWTGVVQRLQSGGFTVLAPANPLRGVASDSAYIASVLATITGPIVLVGHSYGGEVITNAATGNPNVKALVYVAAFAPDEGETSGDLATKFPGTGLTPGNLVFRPFTNLDGTTGTDGYINPSVFHDVFCADLSRSTAAVMAATQRPGSVSTLGEPSGVPAWKTIPSWYVVAKQDRAIPPAVERFMAQRMNAHTIEINSSHVAMISHPAAVTDLILNAAHAVR